MNIVIPLGGLGIRFKDFGYTMPKPLIKAAGKEIILRVVDSIKKYKEKEKSKKGQGTIQLEVEGWTSYFRTASAKQIRESIESEKFQLLPNDAKQKIKMVR